MQRSIDANALKRFAYVGYHTPGKGDQMVVDIEDIDAAPTIGAAPGVRCYKCQFSKERPFLPNENRIHCENSKSPCYCRFTPDGWGCMAGERKDSGKDA